MKKLSKEQLKEIIAGGEICLECAIGYIQVIVEGRCYCIPQD
ncbi:GNAT family acetyltransferase [Chryseobacterium sp. OSA05B]|nr:GNAT family acetyltransferase [Chryseobacterium sp. OSA05B]